MSLRYWAFALHAVSESQNRIPLSLLAPQLVHADKFANKGSKKETSPVAAVGDKANSSQEASNSNPKTAYANYSEAQVA